MAGVWLEHDLSQEAFTATYLLAWIPETLLSEKGEGEWDKFLRMEDRPVLDESDDEGAASSLLDSHSH